MCCELLSFYVSSTRPSRAARVHVYSCRTVVQTTLYSKQRHDYHEQRTAGESHAHCALFERSLLRVGLLVSPVVFPVAVAGTAVQYRLQPYQKYSNTVLWRTTLYVDRTPE